MHACDSCGQADLRAYPRLDRLTWPFRALGLAGLLLGVLGTSTPTVVASLAMLALVIAGRALGGVLWWGGTRCGGCGQVRMLR